MKGHDPEGVATTEGEAGQDFGKGKKTLTAHQAEGNAAKGAQKAPGKEGEILVAEMNVGGRSQRKEERQEKTEEHPGAQATQERTQPMAEEEAGCVEGQEIKGAVNGTGKGGVRPYIAPEKDDEKEKGEPEPTGKMGNALKEKPEEEGELTKNDEKPQRTQKLLPAPKGENPKEAPWILPEGQRGGIPA